MGNYEFAVASLLEYSHWRLKYEVWRDIEI